MIKKILFKISDIDTVKSMLLNLIIKGVSFLISYFYYPILLDYLGDERYGLWATSLSVLTWMNLCDVGIGGGLRNILTKELSLLQKESAQKSISTAYFVLSFFSIIVLIILLLFTFSFGWNKILNTNIDVNIVMIISGFFILLNLILALINVVLFSLQISEQVSLFNLIGSVINIIGIIVLKQFTTGNLVSVAIVYGISTSIPLFLNNVRIYKKYYFLKPRFKFIDKNKIKGLFSLGIIFFILQIGGMMLCTTDNIIISHCFGTTNVTPIDVSSKLFSMIKGFYLAMMVPVWSRTTKAITEKDIKWLNKMYKNLVAILCLFGMGLFFIYILFVPIAQIWLGHKLIISSKTVLVISIGTFAEMITLSYSNMLNGMGLVKVQMFMAIFQILMNIPLSLFCAQNLQMGVLGIKLATTILLSISGIIYVIYTKFSINKFKNTLEIQI